VVACTSDFGLPYQECSDPPCDLAQVWCDLVNLVEAELLAGDDVVARTSTAVPLAMIHYEPDVAVALGGGEVPFDTVLADTDDMVDLTVFPGILPKRNGNYLIDVHLRYGLGLDNAREGAYIRIGNVTMPVIGGTLPAVATAYTRGLTNHDDEVRGSMLWQFNDTSPIPRDITVIDHGTSGTNPLQLATLTVYWHSDVS